MALAVAIFLVALLLIASERIHRTKIALVGAALVVLLVPGFDQGSRSSRWTSTRSGCCWE